MFLPPPPTGVNPVVLLVPCAAHTDSYTNAALRTATVWTAAGDGEDQGTGDPDGEGEPELGLHANRRGARERRARRRQDHGREDPEGRRHRAGARAAQLLADVPASSRWLDRRSRLLHRRGVDGTRPGNSLRPL